MQRTLRFAVLALSLLAAAGCGSDATGSAEEVEAPKRYNITGRWQGRTGISDVYEFNFTQTDSVLTGSADVIVPFTVSSTDAPPPPYPRTAYSISGRNGEGNRVDVLLRTTVRGEITYSGTVVNDSTITGNITVPGFPNPRTFAQPLVRVAVPFPLYPDRTAPR